MDYALRMTSLSRVEYVAVTLADRRRAANLTQEELARRVRVTRKTIQNWEAERTRPSERMERRLERALRRVQPG